MHNINNVSTEDRFEATKRNETVEVIAMNEVAVATRLVDGLDEGYAVYDWATFNNLFKREIPEELMFTVQLDVVFYWRKNSGLTVYETERSSEFDVEDPTSCETFDDLIDALGEQEGRAVMHEVGSILDID